MLPLKGVKQMVKGSHTTFYREQVMAAEYFQTPVFKPRSPRRDVLWRMSSFLTQSSNAISTFTVHVYVRLQRRRQLAHRRQPRATDAEFATRTDGSGCLDSKLDPF